MLRGFDFIQKISNAPEIKKIANTTLVIIFMYLKPSSYLFTHFCAICDRVMRQTEFLQVVVFYEVVHKNSNICTANTFASIRLNNELINIDLC